MEYANYIERNLYNCILAQQIPETGMVDPSINLGSGAKINWQDPTCDFTCCTGTMVQAHAIKAAMGTIRERQSL